MGMNALLMRYAGSAGSRNGNENNMRGEMNGSMNERDRGMEARRSAYNEMGMAYGGAGMRQPNQYTRSEYEGGMMDRYSAMNGGAEMHQPERMPIQEDGREDRRLYEGSMQNRYRGQDGQWKSGSRRNAYGNGMRSAGGYGERRSHKEDEHEFEVSVRPANVVEWPYWKGAANDAEMRNERMIGFGAQSNMGGGRHGGHMMGHGDSHMMDDEPFTRETAMEWTHGMVNEDEEHPKGPRWKSEEAKKLAEKAGVDTDPEGDEFWLFYAALNAVYSDYYKVAKKYGLDRNDMFFADMAVAWLDDEDAVRDKAAMYYKYVVKH